jgi:hypothetical protein
MTKIPAADIPVPVHLRKSKIPSTTSINVSRRFRSVKFFLYIFDGFMFADSDGDDEGESTVKTPETINFVVMLKKNNKPQVNLFTFSFTKSLINILVL